MKPETTQIPRIASGFRLQWEPAQNAHVLLYPEGMVKLNASAGEILRRCDGMANIEAITTDIEKQFDTTGLSADVIAFLDIAMRQGWVQIS